MAVGDCQRAFGAAAARDRLVLVSGSVPGLTSAGHLDLEEMDAARQKLEAIFDLLGGDANDLERGPHRPLPMDWLLPDNQLIIEVDESQHFTTDRLRTLEAYPPDPEVCFSVSEYIELCRILHAGSDKYREAKTARGFQRHGGRRAQRAYFDAVRDLGAPTFGWRVFRVPAGHGDGALAYRESRKALAVFL